MSNLAWHKIDKGETKVIAWVNYGSEGWQPTEFDSDQAAIEWVREGCHSQFVLTRPLAIAVCLPGEEKRDDR